MTAPLDVTADIDDLLVEGRRRFAQRLARPWARGDQRAEGRIEAGFLRSVRSGADGGPPVSYVVDRRGIHYDATAPSDLECLIESSAAATPELRARAAAGMRLLRRRRLSTYNAAPWREPGELDLPPAGDHVLVVDQPRGDPAIGFGMAGPLSFARMLAAARAEHPGATLVVARPADVADARRPGHFDHLGDDADIKLLRGPVNPWALLACCRTVYCVTGHLGFEALIAGASVHCFGMPFYAGWGLTRDRLSCARRTRRAGLEEVFAAAYLLYSRYRDPHARQPCTFEDAVAHLTRLRDHAHDQAPATVLVGMSRWKRRSLRRAFAPVHGRPPRFRRPVAGAWLDGGTERVIGWASCTPPGLVRACAAHAVPFWWLEDGFLRSSGLGSRLVPAASYTLDRQRPHFDCRGPSDLETLLARGVDDPDLLRRARALRERINAAGMSKYNSGRRGLAREQLRAAGGRRVVLVAGQVETDASIRLGTRATRTNLALLAAARARHPDAFVVFKPHPDVQAGMRSGHVPAAVARRYADLVLDVELRTAEVLDAVDHVEIMTSLIGFEALLRGRSVTCHGLPFFAGWGLTEDLVDCPRRRRRLTLDELVAVSLLLYPVYLDPVSGLACSPEWLLDRFVALQRPPSRPPEAVLLATTGMLRRAGRRWRDALSPRRLPAAAD